MRAPFPIEEVVRHPLPGTAFPTTFAFSPDDRYLAWLQTAPGTLVKRLMVLDLQTGEERPLLDPTDVDESRMSLAERLLRERLRERSLGVTRYEWAPRGERLLIPQGGGLLVVDGVQGEPRPLVPPGAPPAQDACFSPDGQRVAYVQDRELYVVPAAGGEPRQVTAGAREAGLSHGLAEYIAQEEMARHRGFWWAPAGDKLAFEEVDERHLPVFRIQHLGKDDPLAHEEHGYPFAGAENARVRLGVVGRDGGPVVWMDLRLESGERADLYLARVAWGPDGALWAQVQDRSQRRLELLRFDAATGARTLVLVEESDAWINLHHLFLPLRGGGFVWGSERTGWMHLYRYDRDGQPLAQITDGRWMVEETWLDESGGLVYFAATAEGAAQRHLYAAPLAGGGEPRRLTSERGFHQVALDRGRRRFVDVHHAVDQQPRITLRSLEDGSEIRELHREDDPRVARLGLRPPELVTLRSRDGVTLHGAVYRPPEGSGPWPTLISVYGGPHAQRVQDAWGTTADMRAQRLAQMGFLVFKLDNRGTARRGLEFEAAIRHNLGDVEVQDQVDGVRWLVKQGLADPARVGIYGWSYGGYMALMALCRAPDVFAAAVAGAPVTHWDGYDTHYTERYMGLPAENPEGYRVSSVMEHVAGMRGKLLLVHGFIDENVHFRHTARLINALIRHRKDHQLLIFPDERHMPRGAADQVYQEDRIERFFVDALGLE